MQLVVDREQVLCAGVRENVDGQRGNEARREIDEVDVAGRVEARAVEELVDDDNNKIGYGDECDVAGVA